MRAVGERFGIGWGSKETGHQENRGLGCRLPQTWGPGGEEIGEQGSINQLIYNVVLELTENSDPVACSPTYVRAGE